MLNAAAPRCAFLFSSWCPARHTVIAVAMTDSGGNVLGWAAPRTSILECFNERDGSIDIAKYLNHAAEECSRQRCVTSAVLLDLISGEDVVAHRNSADVADTAAGREPRKRARKCVWARRSSEDGPLEVIIPQESCWYAMYVSNLYIEQSEKLRAKFRSQFRLPYPNYNELLDAVQVDPLFVRWCGEKYGKKSSSIELLLLGSLRYLGRGWTFDDIKESTAIDKKVHRVFFHKFTQFGSTVLFNKYVVTPVNLQKAMSHMAEYGLAGFPGCVGSCDCTHITTERCEYFLKNSHL
jgi:hypothetical protein